MDTNRLLVDQALMRDMESDYVDRRRQIIENINHKYEADFDEVASGTRHLMIKDVGDGFPTIYVLGSAVITRWRICHHWFRGYRTWRIGDKLKVCPERPHKMYGQREGRDDE